MNRALSIAAFILAFPFTQAASALTLGGPCNGWYEISWIHHASAAPDKAQGFVTELSICQQDPSSTAKSWCQPVAIDFSVAPMSKNSHTVLANLVVNQVEVRNAVRESQIFANGVPFFLKLDVRKKYPPFIPNPLVATAKFPLDEPNDPTVNLVKVKASPVNVNKYRPNIFETSDEFEIKEVSAQETCSRTW